jgi:superfamily I DNA and RNA helicase
MKVTPQSDYQHRSGIIFKNRVLYLVISADDTQYLVNSSFDGSGINYYVPKSEFVVIGDNTILDPRTPLQHMYDDLKQKDHDYKKLYEERLGVLTLTWPEEDALRHGRNKKTEDQGLPEGSAVDSIEKKGL